LAGPVASAWGCRGATRLLLSAILQRSKAHEGETTNARAILSAGPRRTVAELRRRSRDEILDELAVVFAEDGFADVPVGELARRLRCSRSTLYQMAPTHDDLVLAVLGHVFSRIWSAANEAAVAEHGCAARLQAWTLATIEGAGALTPRLRRDIFGWEPARSALEASLRNGLTDFASMFDAAVEAGEVRPANTVFAFQWLQAACSLANDPAFLESAGLTYGGALDEIRQAFFSGFVIAEQRSGITATV
jgi:AcrR family transcriptional regulator